MSLRRSGRLNPAKKNSLSEEVENSSVEHVEETKDKLEQNNSGKEPSQDGNSDYSEVEKVHKEPKEEIMEEVQEKIEGIVEEMEFDQKNLDDKSEKTTSATIKALNKMKTSENFKRKKLGRTPMAHKRKAFNAKLGKLLTPKSALILLHEFKPNCVYEVQEQPGCIPPSFYAQVIYNNEVIGTGQGLSKSHAKSSAAENAIKSIVSKTMTNRSLKKENENDSNNDNDKDNEDTPENLPWAGLASFAIYKMFSDWQSQGTTDLLSRYVSKQKIKPPTTPNLLKKKELPPNAHELHPAVVLNMVCPGLVAVEVERENGPKCRVKMQYTINGEVYSGIGGNKKDAKKEAAKAVLEGLYGLTYAS